MLEKVNELLKEYNKIIPVASLYKLEWIYSQIPYFRETPIEISNSIIKNENFLVSEGYNIRIGRDIQFTRKKKINPSLIIEDFTIEHLVEFYDLIFPHITNYKNIIKEMVELYDKISRLQVSDFVYNNPDSSLYTEFMTNGKINKRKITSITIERRGVILIGSDINYNISFKQLNFYNELFDAEQLTIELNKALKGFYKHSASMVKQMKTLSKEVNTLVDKFNLTHEIKR